MNNKSEIFSTEKILAKEKELKEHPERNRVKTVSLTAEELYEKIMKNGGSYDIEGGILALKRAVDEEKKRERKNEAKKMFKGITNEPLDMEEIKRVEEELERNPYYTDSNVRIVNMTAEELYNDIMQNGGSYDIIGGLPTLKKIIEKEKSQ